MVIKRIRTIFKMCFFVAIILLSGLNRKNVNAMVTIFPDVDKAGMISSSVFNLSPFYRSYYSGTPANTWFMSSSRVNVTAMYRVVINSSTMDPSLSLGSGMAFRSGGVTLASSHNYFPNVGDKIDFSYIPDNPLMMDSTNLSNMAYGKWVDNLGEVVDKKTIEDDGLFFDIHAFTGLNTAVASSNTYITAIKPSVYMESSNPSVISCSGMSCNVLSSGYAKVYPVFGVFPYRAWSVIYFERPPFYAYIDSDKTIYDGKGYIQDFSYNNTEFSSSPFASGSNDTGIGYATDTSISIIYWDMYPTASVINGACGGTDGTYLNTDISWRVPACASGTPDSDPTINPFLNIGETKIWQCVGSGAGRNPDPTCTATRNYATPNVTLTASPSNFSDVNGGTMAVPSTVQTNLTWAISNEPSACAGSCVCDFTEVETSTTISNISYPATSSSLRTIPLSDHNYSITCRNTQGLSDTDTEFVNVECSPQTGTVACNKPCGPGNQITPNLDADCNITNSVGPACVGNPSCPAGTDFKEVAP